MAGTNASCESCRFFDDHKLNGAQASATRACAASIRR